MWCIQLSKYLLDILYATEQINDSSETICFISENYKFAHSVMMHLEVFNMTSQIMKEITIKVELSPEFDTFFQLVQIEEYRLPYHILCNIIYIDGMGSCYQKNHTDLQQHHNKYYNVDELTMIRDRLGDGII